MSPSKKVNFAPQQESPRGSPEEEKKTNKKHTPYTKSISILQMIDKLVSLVKKKDVVDYVWGKI
jgi:hypothetical protein